MKQPQFSTLTIDVIVGGGQALGTLDDGRKAFVWGGLPGEKVTIRITKKKSHLVEGIVTEIHQASSERIVPLDSASYLSTSPWQIMTFEAEQRYKAALIEEAFELHDIVLPNPIEVSTDDVTSHYRNKVEFSWYSEGSEFRNSESSETRVTRGGAAPTETTATAGVEDGADRVAGPAQSDLRTARGGDDGSGEGRETETLDLAFFRRGSKGKIVVDECSLLPDSIMVLARAIRDLLRRKHVTARSLKTLLIRCDQQGNCVWQLYVKDETFDQITPEDAAKLSAQGGEVIYSDPRSPASRITTRLAKFGDVTLRDRVLDIPFNYATEGFFQVNIPVYERALRDMRKWITGDSCVDLYSGVGTIGLTIGGDHVTLVESNEYAVDEMKRNIDILGSDAKAVLAPSEKALEYVTDDMLIIVDPPRAGLHGDVVSRLLETKPPRIIYLSCNPVTQARDVALLAEAYGIRAHRGYNFFPRTPHIEHLIVLDRKA
jgi:23S rRNA (uracil1939-C5)-methyltransferase